MIIQCQFRMNISRDKQDFWSKVWQQKLCDLRISRGQFFAPYFGGQKLDLYAEKYGNLSSKLSRKRLGTNFNFFFNIYFFLRVGIVCTCCVGRAWNLQKQKNVFQWKISQDFVLYYSLVNSSKRTIENGQAKNEENWSYQTPEAWGEKRKVVKTICR